MRGIWPILRPQDIHARQGLAFQPFEEGATGGRDIGEAVGSAGLVQRLLGRFYLNVTGGYALRDYSGTTGTSAATGDQETVSFNASLGTAFLTRGYISVFYNKSWNDSDSATYDLDPQTVGLQISYSY